MAAERNILLEGFSLQDSSRIKIKGLGQLNMPSQLSDHIRIMLWALFCVLMICGVLYVLKCHIGVLLLLILVVRHLSI